ncbi:hypothetical protein HAX54_015997 [Datura stramonium]|uniref:Uncharacterized protein n=1 Tax=Datura stramonium TaxID=4076 RepID=A0ABS8RZK2_DATST|nr:hypothetical protein [Datura stramonium]
MSLLGNANILPMAKPTRGLGGPGQSHDRTWGLLDGLKPRSLVRFPRATCCMRHVLGGGLLDNANILPMARPMRGLGGSGRSHDEHDACLLSALLFGVSSRNWAHLYSIKLDNC